MAPSLVHLPEMALTLVRRTTAKLPYNHFLFRTDTRWTKGEIKEYLEKVYSVKVARIATAISLGACGQWTLRVHGGGRCSHVACPGRKASASSWVARPTRVSLAPAPVPVSTTPRTLLQARSAA
jgi:ribosomal protein L23